MKSRPKFTLNIFWFRRDLRLDDNQGLTEALNAGHPVLPIFIFDQNILEKLPARNDARITFIHQQLQKLQHEVKRRGSSLRVYVGKPKAIFKKLLTEYEIHTVFCNHDYEPYARTRDKQIRDLLAAQQITFQSLKDQVIFEKNEVVKSDGSPYTVFTPYMKRWKQNFYSKKPLQKSINNSNFYQNIEGQIPPLEKLGFVANTNIEFPSMQPDLTILKHYHQQRDFPAVAGTSRLGIHLRFGTLSIRKLVQTALEFNEVFLNELIWREFYMMILWHFPHVAQRSFKPAYDHIPWINDPQQFEHWCQGKTGYPLVDAGMRELNQTGYMHNRIRMVTASFLTKHLLIDWRWGAAYFAEKLLDYELASNNGGWQWAAGTGCDAAPYFRVFNPTLQARKFDQQLKYIKNWVPELNLPHYPKPIVDHAMARKRAIETYKSTLSPA